ncbi:hypothetical protein [Effusibacillus consociatus]|uniref:Uncharacterized protein n=1 Tax=Effusibacillus consociatus TaxID=1117041 RepID=A0ABV9Q217_9BACL
MNKKLLIAGSLIGTTLISATFASGSNYELFNHNEPKSWEEADKTFGKYKGESQKDAEIGKETKSFHVKALKAVGIDVNESKLNNLATLTDKSGTNWTYTSYIQSSLIEDQIRAKYSLKAATSFIKVQEEAMNLFRQSGDTVPVILINPDLTKGQIVFARNEGNGDVVTVNISFDKNIDNWSILK